MSKDSSKVFQKKPKSDIEAIFISSRIRLARNLQDEPFSTANLEEDRSRIFKNCKAAASKLRRFSDGDFLNLQELSNNEIGMLVEGNIISGELAVATGDRGVFISNDSSICIMVNEEDHLRLQAKERGLCLQSLWKKIDSVDSGLEKYLSFAYDKNFGYLTACPTNTGTGMRASVMMHLPALRLQGDMEKISRGLGQLGIVARGFGGESSEPVGAFYQISNQRTLGVTEQSIIGAITEICIKIAEFEENARAKLLEEKPAFLFDKISRAFGILQTSFLLSSTEAIDCLSYLRLAGDMGFLPAKIKADLDSLIFEMRPAHLEKQLGKFDLNAYERDVRRATLIKERLLNIKKLHFPTGKKSLKKSK